MEQPSGSGQEYDNSRGEMLRPLRPRQPLPVDPASGAQPLVAPRSPPRAVGRPALTRQRDHSSIRRALALRRALQRLAAVATPAIHSTSAARKRRRSIPPTMPSRFSFRYGSCGTTRQRVSQSAQTGTTRETHRTMGHLPLRACYASGECPCDTLLRRDDVLVHSEEIVGVILGLDLGEAVVVLAIGGAHQILSLIHNHVDVAATS